jgi:hypothetical protein
MKIRVHTSGGSSRTGTIRVREKTIYICNACRNKYYSAHIFCPQCLGEVVCKRSHTAVLQVSSPPPEIDSAVDLLKRLSENQNFPFPKAFQSLPWLCIMNTDPAVLQHWKECLEAQKIQVELLENAPELKKQRRKPHPPLFTSNAPFPYYFTSTITHAIRKATNSIPAISPKLQWCETVLFALGILESLYKHPTGRILFYDFIFKIEEQIRDFLEANQTLRWSEAQFLKRQERLQNSFERMASEIQAVRDQIQEQL